MKCNFVLYVRDQKKSAHFYCAPLDLEPSLDVPGMTEFELGPSTILGLMPELGIKKLLGDSIQDPEKSSGTSRCELYLTVENPELFMKRASQLEAPILSPVSKRNWGDEAGYIMDLDGHVVAFARKAQ